MFNVQCMKIVQKEEKTQNIHEEFSSRTENRAQSACLKYES